MAAKDKLNCKPNGVNQMHVLETLADIISIMQQGWMGNPVILIEGSAQTAVVSVSE